MTVEIINCTCPECGQIVEVQWDNGVISSPDYVLVADWVFHSKCWDKIVEEYDWRELDDTKHS